MLVPSTLKLVPFNSHHASRRIVQFAITENPVREFVKQQMIDFEEKIDTAVYMIRDRAPEFFWDYSSYGIKEICTAVKAPNMNSITERFIGSLRREVLDYFLKMNMKQLKNILTEYIDYYNSCRPHKGIGQSNPEGNIFNKEGSIRRKKVLGGLHSHYFRDVA